MKTNVILSALFISLIFCTRLDAQSCDPWITKAYKELYQRNPTAAECNIKNYNNGSWNNYSELVNYIKAYSTKKNSAPSVVLKGDPWIFRIYQELYNRKPNAWELNVTNYNKGSWSSYASLRNYIKDFQTSLKKNKLNIKTADGNGNVYVVFEKDGKPIAINLVSQNGGQVIAAGDGNVIAAGGGNVVAAGGLNLQITPNMAGVTFGDKFRTQSVGTTIIPSSGNGALIIR